MPATTQITDKIISDAIVASLRNVFWTMLQQMPSLEAPASAAIQGEDDGKFEVIGSVGFAGEVSGTVYLCLTEEFARLSTAHVLGMTPAEVAFSGSDLVKDAIGEVTNMTAGGFKNELCDLGLPCKLGLPTILRGHSLAVASSKSITRHLFWFQCSGHRLAANILIRND
ncbi:MAG TPA: chemotaxis protein CheX [Candidatus Didemnitutus sp.]|nr:chemotaxis protein CheX [Candidatus Didemnitutus sp.]